MADIGFAPKEIIPPEVCRLEVMAADKAEEYGLQIALKLKVLGGAHDGHSFTDYANRDDATGQVKQGGKAWSIYEACLGHDFHKQPGVSLTSLVGKQFVAQVTSTKTGSRNKIEFGTVGPIPSEAGNETPKPASGNGEDDEIFNDIPF